MPTGVVVLAIAAHVHTYPHRYLSIKDRMLPLVRHIYSFPWVLVNDNRLHRELVDLSSVKLEIERARRRNFGGTWRQKEPSFASENDGVVSCCVGVQG